MKSEINESKFRRSTSRVQREERMILYRVYKQKFMVEAKLFSLGSLLSEYLGRFDKTDLERILDNLVKQGYLVKRNGDFGIPNARKFQEIKRFFWKHRALDWIKIALLETWLFLWKHFIVTIILAVITAYITAKIVK
jgi:hypothetical protein